MTRIEAGHAELLEHGDYSGEIVSVIPDRPARREARVFCGRSRPRLAVLLRGSRAASHACSAWDGNEAESPVGDSQAGLFLGASANVYWVMPSTMNERDFVVLSRIALIFCWSAELFQACAFSMLSKAMRINRCGAVPSRAVILSVRVM